MLSSRKHHQILSFFCFYFILLNCGAGLSLIQSHGGKMLPTQTFCVCPLSVEKDSQLKLEYLGLSSECPKGFLGQVPRHPLPATWGKEAGSRCSTMACRSPAIVTMQMGDGWALEGGSYPKSEGPGQATQLM